MPERVAFVVATARGTDPHRGQGPLDVDAFGERLMQPDAGFQVVRLDASEDLVVTMEDRLGQSEDAPQALAFFASARALVDDGEVLLVLDAESPDTGDALRDVFELLVESSAYPPLAMLDLRTVGAAPEALAALVKELAKSMPKPIEVMISARALDDAVEANPESLSPFTRALLQGLDAADPSEGLYAVELYEKLQDDGGAGASGVFAYNASQDSLPLLMVEDAGTTDEVDADGGETPIAPPVMMAELRASEIEATQSTGIDRDPESERTLPSHAALAMPPPAEAAEVAEIPPAPLAVATETTTAPVAASEPPKASTSVAPASRSRPPSSPPAPFDLVADAEELADQGNDEEALARLRKALALVGSQSMRPLAPDEMAKSSVTPSDLVRADIYRRMAEIRRRQGKPREAIASFEKALALDPALGLDVRFIETLLALCIESGDQRAAQNFQDKILSLADGDEARATLHLRFGAVAEERFKDAIRAREAYESALAVSPGNEEAIARLLRLAEAEGRTEDALALRRGLAELGRDLKRSARELDLVAKELLRQKRDDEALDILEKALEADPESLEPLAAISRILAERQEWSELEAAYRRMVGRLPRVADESLARELSFELHRRLGLLLRDHLEDQDAALVALGLATQSRPMDVGAHRLTAELARKMGRHDVEESHLLSLAGLEPGASGPFRALFDLFVRSEQVERASGVAGVLVHIGAASDRERVVFESNRSETTSRPRGALLPEDWALLRAPIHPGEPDVEPVARVFRAIGPAAVAALSDLAKLAGRLPPLNEKLRVDASTSTVSAARAIAWGSAALGLPVPTVYLEEASTDAMVSVLRDERVTVVGAGALRGRDLPELSFLTGHHLAGHVDEHRLVRLCTSIDDLAACFLAAAKIAVPDIVVPERMRALVDLLLGSLKRRLDEAAEEELEGTVIDVDAGGGKADLVAYARSVERAGLRAGLLLSGDFQSAVRTARGLEISPLDPNDREGELCVFAASPAYRTLRERLGVDG